MDFLRKWIQYSMKTLIINKEKSFLQTNASEYLTPSLNNQSTKSHNTENRIVQILAKL